MKNKILTCALALTMLFSLAACGGGEEDALTLSQTEITLTEAGATAELSATVTGDVEELTWSSSDESVATVDDNGKVTAVAAGTATITVTGGELSATCTVKCEWSDPVVLADLYNEIYESLYPLDADGNPTGPHADDVTAFDMATVEMTYPGLTDIETKQLHAYIPMMTAVAYEVVMVEVANAADVEAVKAILQARIDAQVDGGGWYPQVVEGWENDSRIVSNGNYIMMAVGSDCDTFVDMFNAKF